MQVVHPVCCGLDVHQATQRRVCAVSALTARARRSCEFGTTYAALLALSDWARGPALPGRSDGEHRRVLKPVYHVLVGVVEVLVGNAREMRPRPGKPTRLMRGGLQNCERMA